MVVYKRKVNTRDARFRGRVVGFLTANSYDEIPVADTEVICNSCNRNIHNPDDPESYGWLIYLDKRSVKRDQPYDIYCDACTKRSWPKAIEVVGISDEGMFVIDSGEQK